MRHRKKGRQLGRSSSHKKAMLRNLATSLILTERDEDYYNGLFQADGKTPVAPPKYKGRVVTTIHKAKEVRSLVEKMVTIARKALASDAAAAEFETDAERYTPEWESWRKGENWLKWVNARAAGVTARRRVFDVLRDKEAVSILFEDIAPRFEDRPGGYTRVMRLAKPRLGDAGVRAILEFVGKNDRVVEKSEMPAFDDEGDDTQAVADDVVAAEVGSEVGSEVASDDSSDDDSSKE